MARPGEALQEPQAEDPMPGWIPYFIGGNFVSPAYYLNEASKTLLGVDVFGWASQQVAGDWEAVKKASGAAGNLAAFNTSFHDTVMADWQNTLENTWRGNAADSARSYFHGLAGSVEFQVRSLEEIERTLNNISNAMVNLGRVLGDLLQGIADLIIMWLAKMAAAAIQSSAIITAPTAAATYAAAAVDAVRIVAKYQQMVNATGTAFKVVVGLGATALHLSSRTPEDLPPLPEPSYDHPGA
ncbi:WXG100 family type VII secretion target [Nocardia cyriacigeorgica]|uniref:WXG100 family type VII secretion target n=1 Tax=Nocardia cyriacigeorgica TaxID=135487 RepID=A0A6P1DB32_9NOCA|nr:WXG100 family type VII secretion target [Nocardia cyriacigeorgica]NEW40978.1 WXG100 family type VII secretion target [Nocardia cyriacigeorgica]NEW47348.1 WXG100 family type VII secretion target [Nocardia cyriacigeorgica]NEW51216.1 WXG100 family type VII secretion target [Nocardia cyriacigeorgica]NEW55286.1 WXG100 family type VII secretion target [Nocardia cyriacigeorgica]